jgi:hypothetical protein
MSMLKAKKLFEQRRIMASRLDDFEEQIMFGDLEKLLADMEHDRAVPEEIVRGLESLKYFRDFYHPRRDAMADVERARVAAYDAAWCMELIDLARRERGSSYYRA